MTSDEEEVEKKPNRRNTAAEKREQEIFGQKIVAFYAAVTDAWLGNSMELDRSILTLSAAGIGLLMTLFISRGVFSLATLVLYLTAIIAFTTSLVVILFIFHWNKSYLESVARGTGKEADPRLEKCDLIARVSFAAGIAFTAFLGIVTICQQYIASEVAMSDETSKIQNVTQIVNVEKSVNRVTGLDPSLSISIHSANGISNLQPQPSSNNNTSTTSNGSSGATGSSSSSTKPGR